MSREESARGGRSCARGALVLLAMWAACVVIQPGIAAEVQPGRSSFGRSNYVEYIAGDMPIVISVPHGGSLTPAEIPDRNCEGRTDDCATVSDAYTDELALAVCQAFRQYLGHCPHVIICGLKRTKLDCNRSMEEGADRDVHAEQAWREYHQYVKGACESIAAAGQRGLYIDLHGQSHPLKRIELGYLLTAEQLTNTDAALDRGGWGARSSIAELAARVPVPFSQLLRGSNSLGGMLLSKGYPSVPDPVMPSPRGGAGSNVAAGEPNLYFGGGYSTRVHGSANGGGPVDGVQMEVNMDGLRDTAANRTNFAVALARTMDRFFAVHYRFDLKTGKELPAGEPAASRTDSKSVPRGRASGGNQ